MRIGFPMVLKDSLHRCSHTHILQRVAQQVAQHPDVSGVRQFNQHGDVRPVFAQRGVYRMMGTLPAENQPCASTSCQPTSNDRQL